MNHFMPPHAMPQSAVRPVQVPFAMHPNPAEMAAAYGMGVLQANVTDHSSHLPLCPRPRSHSCLPLAH